MHTLREGRKALTLRHCKLVLSTTFWQYRDGSPLGSEYKLFQEQEAFFCMTKIWEYYPSKGCCLKEIKGLENSVSQLHFVSNWMTLHTIYHQQIDIMQQSKAWLDCTLFSFKAEWGPHFINWIMTSAYFAKWSHPTCIEWSHIQAHGSKYSNRFCVFLIFKSNWIFC